MGVFVDINRIVRASLHAHFAPDAQFIVEVDDAVGANKQCLGGATLHAGRISAVIASKDGHFSCGRGKLALFDVLHPGTKLTDRNVMLSLAGHRAGVAADTGPLVNGESIALGRSLLPNVELQHVAVFSGLNDFIAGLCRPRRNI